MDYSKIFIKDAKPTKIGGQAVMEGVMMHGADKQALAVRLPNGDIKLEIEDIKTPSKVTKVPFVRGVVSFFSSLISGMKTLMRSSEILEEAMPEEEQEETSKFDQWLERKFSPKTVWNVMLGISVAISLLITVVVFVIMPTYSVNLLKHVTKNTVLLNLAEGVLRLAIFVLYVLAISKMNDVKRLFQYHGAEHETIHCFENGLELTPANAKEFYTLHPRCGTSFLMFVMIISLVLFSFLGWPNLAWRIISRLLLMPVIAGISYELLRWAGRSDNAVVRVLSWPGLMMQKLTTREPDEEQLEVAITSLKAVLGELEPGVISKQDEDISDDLEVANEEEELDSIFDNLEDKRYSEDETMVKNLVRAGRAKLGEAGISNPNGDADDIFCYVTGFTHNEIITRDTELLDSSDVEAYRERIDQRAAGVPLQYITKVQEFMGLPFCVNENVLIPRLDTEVLVDQVLGIISGMELERPEVLDMCTGSGAIGISIASLTPGARVKLADISEKALEVARKNAEINDVLDRVSFALGNMFSSLDADEKFDLIVSNPPYIKSEIIETLDPEVKDHEPRLALDGGEDGLDAYKVIANNAASHLKEGGVLALEIGYDQGEAVSFLLERTHYYKPAAIIKDLAGMNRVVIAEKKPAEEK
ncbi:peptide chain release factor N(5)-glutamine methyltransferase [Mogibacterium sp.]